jgi:hypothetical protein
MARQGQQVDLTIWTAALARERRTAAKAAHILTSLIFFPIGQHGQPTNLDSFYKQPDTWTALISSPLSKDSKLLDSSLQHVKGSKSRPASMGSTSPSSLPLRVPPSNTMQHIHVTCRTAPAAAAVGQHLGPCSFWQHLQGAEPLLDSSMGCTYPPHQQHLQGSRMGRHSTAGTATHPRLAAPSPHGLLDSSIHSLPFQQIQASSEDKREEKAKGETIRK